MKYLEDERLTKLTSELSDAAVGGSRVINGRIEAYTMKRAGTDKKYAHALGERYVAEMELAENQRAIYQQLLDRHPTRKRSQSAGAQLEALTPPSKHARVEGQEQPKRARACSFDSTKSAEATSYASALGDFQEMGTRRLMTDLILTLNASFPDYDFGDVRPEHFSKVPKDSAMREANDRLSVLASQKGEAFLSKLWTSIDEVITLSDADVYSFVPRDESFLTQTLVEDDTATPLWSFNYFLVNKHMKRIVFFCCVETMQVEDEYASDVLVTKSVGYSERGNESNFDMDPSSDVAGGFPVDL